MSRPRIDGEVLHLLRAGEAPRQIAARLDRRPGSIARALHRAGRTDLAKQFWRLDRLEVRRSTR